MDLTWVTEAPLEELSAGAAGRALKAIVSSIQKDWTLQDASTPEAKAWNRRQEQTAAMLSQDLTGDRIIAYNLAGACAGLISLSKGDPPTVNVLVTHPGSRYAGYILIERAVQISDEWGKGGRLKLLMLYKDSQEFYGSLGFSASSDVQPDKLALDPAQATELWVKLSGVWQLKRFAGKKFAAGEGQEPLDL